MSIFGAKWSESRGKSAMFDLGKSVKSKGIIASEIFTYFHMNSGTALMFRVKDRQKIVFLTNVLLLSYHIPTCDMWHVT